MWQTYDWYLDTNGGYFGAKAGNRPVKAIWDPREDTIVLSNATPRTYTNITTSIRIYDLHGALVSSEDIKTALLEPDAYGVVIAKADFSKSATDMVFLRLSVTNEDGTALHESGLPADFIYWHNRRHYQDCRALGALENTVLDAAVLSAAVLPENGMLYTICLENRGTVPAVQAKLKAFDCSGNQLLPTFFSDNYDAAAGRPETRHGRGAARPRRLVYSGRLEYCGMQA